MAENIEPRDQDEFDVEDVDDGEALPDRIAMSLITPTGEDPAPVLEPLRGPEDL
jgi:hypothetical protein